MLDGSAIGTSAKEALVSNVDVQNLFRSAFAAPVAIYFASYAALKVRVLVLIRVINPYIRCIFTASIAVPACPQGVR